MATFRENLLTRRNAIAAELAAGETPDGQSFRKPNLSIDGESRDTAGYVRQLNDELKSLNALLADPMSSIDSDSDLGTGPFEIVTYGDT